MKNILTNKGRKARDELYDILPSFINRKVVGVGGDFETLKEAVDWFNASATTCWGDR
jgi:hypothetical protein